jgi:hypothetical protein
MSRQHRRLARYIDGEGDEAQRYRELVIDTLDEATQRLTLVMRDLAFNTSSPEEREYIVLPLAASVPTVSADAPRLSCIEEYPNFVIPILPKRYATLEPDPAQAQELRKGWLYVYRNGHLWRELEVMEHGHARDVNLRRHQGKDERPASGEVDSRVLIPYKMGGIHQQIEIAYSEVQWSWARINALGGMDPDPTEEPRLRPDTLKLQAGKEQAAANRRARMQDFTAELKRHILGEDTENIQSVENCTAEIYSLHLHRFSKLPVVYLHDPLGVAMDLADQHEAAWADMESFIEALRVGLPPKKMALEVRRGDTFDEAEQALRQQVAAQFQVAVLMQQIGFTSEENRKKYGRHLSRKCLDVLLGAGERRQLRQVIMVTRDSLVSFLESRAYQTALDDYLDNTPERRLNGKGVVLYAARFLEQPANFLDAWLDPPDTHTAAERQTSQAAQAYMSRLKTTGNSAGLLLAENVEIRTESTSRPAARPRTVALLQDDAAPQSLRLKTILEDQGVDLATRAGAIGTALIEAFSSIKADLQTLEWVSERVNTLKVPGFGEYTVLDVSLPEPKIPEGYHPVGGEATSLARPSVTYKAALALGARAVTADGMMSVVQKNRIAIFPATLEMTEVTARQLVRKDLKPLPARLAARYHDSIPRAVAIAPFFVALDLLNLRTVLHQIANGEIKGLDDVGLRGLHLISAVSGVAQGMAETGNLWLRVGKMDQSPKLRVASNVGRVVGNVAMGIFNLIDGYRSDEQRDQDAATAKYIAAGAFFGLAAATTWAWAIPLTLVAVGGILAGTWLEDDSLERFAKNGPLHLPPKRGGTAWEKIRTHAQAPPVEASFSAEWPQWTEIERLFLDEYLLGFGVETSPRGSQERSFPPVYVDALSATCTLQRFVPMLSQAEIFCHYHSGGAFSSKPSVIHPTVEDLRTDKDTRMISRIGVSFPIPQEHLRNQSPYWSAIIFCRIKPQTDREDFRPPLGGDGSPRYLAIYHHGNGMMRKTSRRMGTMQELTSPDIWRTT